MILVTGGTGFVGSHLLLHLVKNDEKVRAIYRDVSHIAKTRSLFDFYTETALFDRISWILADIIDVPSLEPAFEDVTMVYHCAAFVSFDPRHEDVLRKVNIEGTANIANLSLAFGVSKLCHVSSIAALGDLHEWETTINEETEWNPEKYHSDYAISKFGAEMEIWRAQQEGLQVVIVNPGVIIGPGFSEGSAEIFIKIRDGLSYYTKGTTGFTSVDSVVNAMYRLMNSDVSGERFCIVSDNIGFDELSKQIAANLGVKGPSHYASKWMTELAWRFDGILAIFGGTRRLTKATARSLHAIDRYSGEKIVSAVGFEYAPIESAIAITSKYFAQN